MKLLPAAWPWSCDVSLIRREAGGSVAPWFRGTSRVKNRNIIWDELQLSQGAVHGSGIIIGFEYSNAQTSYKDASTLEYKQELQELLTCCGWENNREKQKNLKTECMSSWRTMKRGSVCEVGLYLYVFACSGERAEKSGRVLAVTAGWVTLQGRPCSRGLLTSKLGICLS